MLFSAKHPELRLAYDATALKEAICLRRYYYTMVRGFRKEGADLDWGSFYHLGREVFDTIYERTGVIEDGLRAAIRAVMIDSYGWKYEGVDNYKNRRTAVRALIWAVEDLGTNVQPLLLSSGQLATELNFAIPVDLKNPFGEDYLICGYMDGLCEIDGQAVVLERKTTKMHIKSKGFEHQYNPDTQTSMYAMAASILYGKEVSIWGVLLEACQTGVGFSRFRRLKIRKTPAQNEEFLNEVLYHIKRIEDATLHSYWPKNEAACSMYGGCMFRKICSMSPESREPFLETNFVKRTWNPLEKR